MKNIIFLETLVKVFGYNLNEENWKEVMVGRSPHWPGRLTMALYVVLSQLQLHKEVRLLIGTGASQKDGFKEADWTKKFLIDNLFEITSKFSIFEKISFLLIDKVTINRISDTETVSKTTRQEVIEAIRIMKILEPKTVFLVSDIAHLPRCARDFSLVMEAVGLFNSLINVYSVFSYFPYQENINILIEEQKSGEPFKLPNDF